jgi:hypothetical protein
MTIIQYINLFLVMFSIVVIVLWYIEDRERWRYAATILLVLSHMLVFYLALFSENVGIFTRPFEDFFTFWSSLLRTHLLIATITSFCILIEWKNLWKILKK